jgi:hypothetical protein
MAYNLGQPFTQGLTICGIFSENKTLFRCAQNSTPKSLGSVEAFKKQKKERAKGKSIKRRVGSHSGKG